MRKVATQSKITTTLLPNTATTLLPSTATALLRSTATTFLHNIATIFLLAVAFVLTACTSDYGFGESDGNTVTLSYTVGLPSGIDSRAYSDGETAMYLTYGVYEAGTTNLVLSVEREEVVAGKRANVEITLMKGSTYDIVFWVDAGKSSNYTIDLEQRTVAMNYTANASAADS